MKSNNNPKHINAKQNKLSVLHLVPLLIIVGIIPLIVYAKYIDLTGTVQGKYWTGQMNCLDFFSFWKSQWLVTLTAFSLCLYVILCLYKRLPFKNEYKFYIPMVIYIFIVFLSTLLAFDKSTAYNGYFDSYQGAWVLLSYIMLVFLTINFTTNEADYKIFMYLFTFLIITEGVIGVCQYFGFDLFKTSLGKDLIVPNNIQLDGDLTFNFGKYEIYGTLFNTNFVGSFANLMIPMSILFLVTTKSLKSRIIAIISFVLCIFTMIGCNSRAGYLGIFFIGILAVILLRKYILKHLKIIIPVTTILIVIMLVITIVFGGKFITKIKSFSQIFDSQDIEIEQDRSFIIESIEINKNIVSVKSNLENMNIVIEDDKLYLTDENNEKLPMKKNDLGNIVADISNGVYLQIKMAENYPGFSLYTPWLLKGAIHFYIDNNRIYIMNSAGFIIDLKAAESFKWLKSYDNFASYRGYIWGRTIPLLKNYLFYGAGPDNFVYVFPQYDYITKMNIGINCNSIIDKAHNYYLQVAVDTGVVSLIALLTIFVFYIVDSIKLIWHCNFNSFEKKFGLSCFLSVVGYLLTGIFNDQIVSVAPLFYIILGLGISVNHKLSKKENENV